MALITQSKIQTRVRLTEKIRNDKANTIVDNLVQHISRKQDPINGVIHSDGWIPVSMANIPNISKTDFNVLRFIIGAKLKEHEHIICRVQRQNGNKFIPVNMRPYEYKWVEKDEKIKLGINGYEFKNLDNRVKSIIQTKMFALGYNNNDVINASQMASTLLQLHADKDWIKLDKAKLSIRSGLFYDSMLKAIYALEKINIVLTAFVENNSTKKKSELVRMTFNKEEYARHKSEIVNDCVQQRPIDQNIREDTPKIVVETKPQESKHINYAINNDAKKSLIQNNHSKEHEDILYKSQSIIDPLEQIVKRYMENLIAKEAAEIKLKRMSEATDNIESISKECTFLKNQLDEAHKNLHAVTVENNSLKQELEQLRSERQELLKKIVVLEASHKTTVDANKRQFTQVALNNMMGTIMTLIDRYTSIPRHKLTLEDTNSFKSDIMQTVATVSKNING